MWSDLSDWFYNLKNLNANAFLTNLVDEIQDEMMDVVEITEDQIAELYQRVRVLELAEVQRQIDSMIAATEGSLKKERKAPKVVKKSTKKVAKRQ